MTALKLGFGFAVLPSGSGSATALTIGGDPITIDAQQITIG